MNVLCVLTIKCVLTSARTPWLSAIILLNWSGLTVIQYWVFNNVTKCGLFTRPTYVVVVPHRTANTVVQRPRAVLLLRQHRQHLPSLVSVAFDILPPCITSITMNTISNPSPKANGFHYWGGMHDNYWCGLSWKPVCKTCSVCQDMLAECKASFYQLAGALEQTNGHVHISVQCAVWSVCRHGCRQFVDGGTLRAGPPASVGFNSCEDVKSKKKEPIVLWLIWAFVVWIHIWNMLLFLINHAITQTNLYTPAEINWVYAVSLLLLLLQAKIFWTGKCTICWIGPCLSCLTLWQMHSVLEQCNIYMCQSE